MKVPEPISDIPDGLELRVSLPMIPIAVTHFHGWKAEKNTTNILLKNNTSNSNKENIPSVPMEKRIVLPRLSLHKIDSVASMNPRESLAMLNMDERDHALLVATFCNNSVSEYRKHNVSRVTKVSSVKHKHSNYQSVMNISNTTNVSCRRMKKKENDPPFILPTPYSKNSIAASDRVTRMSVSTKNRELKREIFVDLVNVKPSTMKDWGAKIKRNVKPVISVPPLHDTEFLIIETDESDSDFEPSNNRGRSKQAKKRGRPKKSVPLIRANCSSDGSSLHSNAPKRGRPAKKSKPSVCRNYSLNSANDEPDLDFNAPEPEIERSSSSNAENYEPQPLGNFIEDFVVPSDSNSHHKNLQEFTDSKINKTEEGAVIRKDLCVTIEEIHDTQSVPEASPVETTTLVSTSITRNKYKKSQRGSQRRLSVQKTTGIKVQSRKLGVEKRCTKVIKTKYTETIDQPHHLCNKLHALTRSKTASSAETDFFALTNSKKIVFTINTSSNSKRTTPDMSCKEQRDIVSTPCNKIATTNTSFSATVNNKLRVILTDCFRASPMDVINNTERKKKLNVSFKLKESPEKKESCRTLRTSKHMSLIPSILDSSISDRNTPSMCLRSKDKCKKKRNYYESSADEKSVQSKEKKPTKRMKKAEATMKTERYNASRKNMARSIKNALNNSTLKTPEPFRLNESGATQTLRINLNKYEFTDINSYAITPLRDERIPKPSKTPTDYGIDDINTDDSTDDEECPKKVVPEWAKNIQDQNEWQCYASRNTISTWMVPPVKKFTVKSLFG